jgi:DNA repair exonuclease SbcCD ATPase subunit
MSDPLSDHADTSATNNRLIDFLNARLGQAENSIVNLDEKITQRFNRFEDQVTKRDEGLIAQFREIRGILSEQSKNAPCPAPGKCIQLESTLTEHKNRLSQIEEMLRKVSNQGERIDRINTQVSKVETKLERLESFQNKVLGAVAVIMVVLTLFGPSIRRAIGLE